MLYSIAMSYHVYVRELKDDISYDVISTYREPGAPKGSKPKHHRLATFRHSSLIKEHADPKAWVEEYARSVSAEAGSMRKEAYTIDYRLRNKEEVAGEDGENGIATTDRRKCIGYFPYLAIWYELGLDRLFEKLSSSSKRKFDHDTIMQELSYARCLFPSSKLAFHTKMHPLFLTPPKYEYELWDVYRCLDDLLGWRDDVIRHLDDAICRRYNRSHLLIYYDVTNYYFEIDGEDGLRARGVSKEHRPEPIVQMGLAMDEMGIPIAYELFRGNTSDRSTLEPMMDSPVLDLSKATRIWVADKGMMSADNIARIRLEHNGYVISQSVRGSDDETKEWVLEDSNWQDVRTSKLDSGEMVCDWKIKERTVVRRVEVSERDPNTLARLDGKHVSHYNERQICIYSRKYAIKAEQDRQLAIGKALKATGSESKDAKVATYGKNKYLKKTAKKVEDGSVQDADLDFFSIEFDYDKLAEERLYDGYYIISTNVIGLKESRENLKRGKQPYGRCRSMYTKDGFLKLNRIVSARDIVDIYGSLWRIEETFKITKTGMLDLRPVFHSQEKRIRAHFLLCFISLVLERVLEHRIGNSLSARRIASSLSSITGVRLPNSNTFLFSYYDEVLDKLGKEFGIDYAWTFRRTSALYKVIADMKKEK